MNRTLLLLALLLPLAAPAPVCAQRGEDDRGRRERNRDEDQGERRRGRDRGGNEDNARRGGRGNEGDRSDRFRMWMQRMDRNGDGVIQEDEAGDRGWRMITGQAERYGLRVRRGRIAVDDIVKARARGANASSDDGPQAAGFESGDSPQAQGFDGDSSDERGGDRSDRGGDDIRDRARDTARDLMEKYDTNRNRRLERDEWSKISGSPEKSDANGDGIITRDELRSRLEFTMRRKASEQQRSRGRADRSRDDRRDRASSDDDERRSYRFTTAHERLPDNLPDWFRDRDRDYDGQVAMHEYSRSWNDRRAEEFARYDLNGDGVIEASEAEGQR